MAAKKATTKKKKTAAKKKTTARKKATGAPGAPVRRRLLEESELELLRQKLQKRYH